jgi:acetylornithine deacetylase/succinyl-diaminopimelate desuccinylase-like protein
MRILMLKTSKIFGLEKDHVSLLVVFAGHTDVVPPGNIDEWNTDPFEGQK